MKKITLLFILSVVLISCKDDSKKEVKTAVTKEIVKENYPADLAKVFEKHGGIDTWRNSKTLSFNKGEEVHTSDLHSRKIVINSPDFSLGFNGKEVWLTEEKEEAYKGNPDFYYNLYFYFYAMPFVLADDGITYTKVEDLIFEGTNYPGYKISYASDKGTSPDDNYVIYYNAATFQMEWLAYTVTFKSKSPSDTYKMIRYNKWEITSGLVLPKEIIWYEKDENGNPTEAAKQATEFTLPLVSEAVLGASFFEKPVK